MTSKIDTLLNQIDETLRYCGSLLSNFTNKDTDNHEEKHVNKISINHPWHDSYFISFCHSARDPNSYLYDTTVCHFTYHNGCNSCTIHFCVC